MAMYRLIASGERPGIVHPIYPEQFDETFQIAKKVLEKYRQYLLAWECS